MFIPRKLMRRKCSAALSAAAFWETFLPKTIHKQRPICTIVVGFMLTIATCVITTAKS
jgi:hypothetical protein